MLSIWNFKAKLWVKGRSQFPEIDYTNTLKKLVWMHCASLGEFEQGRPLIEAIRKNYPDCKIVLSFFSPSGYETTKNFTLADNIIYLPEDSAENAEKLIHLIKPNLVLWIKYEYWFFVLNELKKKNIPALLISGVYRTNMPFFKWYGSLWKKMLGSFTHFFVQNSASEILLKQLINEDKITNSGDTRFDRVITISEKFTDVEGIKKFCGDQPIIVAGSTWEDDEAEWVHFVKVHPEIKFIIAPHEIDKENLADVKKQFATSVFYSEWIANNHQQTTHCLIIDNIGMLSRLYKYATVCYVGGGFRSDGLHNILEAAVYEKPVLFGPGFEKNFEAIEMMEHGGAMCINNAIELEKILNTLLSNTEALQKAGRAAKNYVYSKAGATQKIMDYIRKNAFLQFDQIASQKGQNPSSQS